MLSISNLHATVADKPILNGLTLTVPAGEVHAIMGPNGAGKSTLAYVLGGRPGYEVTGGSVTFMGEDMLAMEPHERAAAGLFLGGGDPIHGLQQAVASHHNIASPTWSPQNTFAPQTDFASHNNVPVASNNDLMSPDQAAGANAQNGAFNLGFGDITLGDKTSNTATEGGVVNTGTAGDIDTGALAVRQRLAVLIGFTPTSTLVPVGGGGVDWWWLLILLLVLAVAGGLWYWRKRRRHARSGDARSGRHGASRRSGPSRHGSGRRPTPLPSGM